jgi:hypothetical protein
MLQPSDASNGYPEVQQVEPITSTQTIQDNENAVSAPTATNELVVVGAAFLGREVLF